MSERSVLHALSAVTKAELRYFRLVQCNVREILSAEELDKFYYLCLGKHSFFVLDRNMIADEQIDEEGLLVKVPYTAIELITERPKEKDSELFEIKLFSGARVQGCGSRLLVRTSARDLLLGQLSVCWKTDYMYQHWRVARFPRVVGDVELLKPDSGEDYPQSWNYDGRQEGRDFATSPAKYTQCRHRGYMFFAPDAFKLPAGKGGAGRGRSERGAWRGVVRGVLLCFAVWPPPPAGGGGQRVVLFVRRTGVLPPRPRVCMAVRIEGGWGRWCKMSIWRALTVQLACSFAGTPLPPLFHPPSPLAASWAFYGILDEGDINRVHPTQYTL